MATVGRLSPPSHVGSKFVEFDLQPTRPLFRSLDRYQLLNNKGRAVWTSADRDLWTAWCARYHVTATLHGAQGRKGKPFQALLQAMVMTGNAGDSFGLDSGEDSVRKCVKAKVWNAVVNHVNLLSRAGIVRLYTVVDDDTGLLVTRSEWPVYTAMFYMDLDWDLHVDYDATTDASWTHSEVLRGARKPTLKEVASSIASKRSIQNPPPPQIGRAAPSSPRLPPSPLSSSTPHAGPDHPLELIEALRALGLLGRDRDVGKKTEIGRIEDPPTPPPGSWRDV